MASLIGGFVFFAVLAIVMLFVREWLEGRYPRPFQWSRSAQGVVTWCLIGLALMAGLAGLFIWLGVTGDPTDAAFYYTPVAVLAALAIRPVWQIGTVIHQTRSERSSWHAEWIRR